MPLITETIDDARALTAHVREWDALAVAARRPMCAPGWALAWWSTAAPESARLCAVTVHEDGCLVGLAPGYLERRAGRHARLRMLAAAISARVEPLAAPGREADVAAAVAAAWARERPREVMLEGLDGRMRWARLLAELWPGGARSIPVRRGIAPFVDLSGGYDAWLAARSRNFRSKLGQSRRRLGEAGGTVRRATGDSDVTRAVEALVGHHLARFAPRGGSSVDAGVKRTLFEAAGRLAAGDRARLWIVEVGEAIVASNLFLAAGGEVSYWLGGYDEAWGATQPSLLCVQAAIEDAARRGESRVDLGEGTHPYKYRFAVEDEPLHWAAVVPHGAAEGLVLFDHLAQRARRAAATRAPERLKDVVRRRGRAKSRPAAG